MVAPTPIILDQNYLLDQQNEPLAVLFKINTIAYSRHQGHRTPPIDAAKTELDVKHQ